MGRTDMPEVRRDLPVNRWRSPSAVRAPPTLSLITADFLLPAAGSGYSKLRRSRSPATCGDDPAGNGNANWGRRPCW